MKPARQFAAALEAAPPSQRPAVWRDYAVWIKAGARAGRAWTGSGALLIAAPVLVVGLSWLNGLSPTLPLIALAVMAVIAGGLLFAIGARKERRWRETHPFAQSRETA